jgi:hypothetical protein
MNVKGETISIAFQACSTILEWNQYGTQYAYILPNTAPLQIPVSLRFRDINDSSIFNITVYVQGSGSLAVRSSPNFTWDNIAAKHVSAIGKLVDINTLFWSGALNFTTSNNLNSSLLVVSLTIYRDCIAD